MTPSTVRSATEIRQDVIRTLQHVLSPNPTLTEVRTQCGLDLGVYAKTAGLPCNEYFLQHGLTLDGFVALQKADVAWGRQWNSLSQPMDCLRQYASYLGVSTCELPRNLHVLQLIQLEFPNFRWQLCRGEDTGKQFVTYENYPLKLSEDQEQIEEHPSLLTLLVSECQQFPHTKAQLMKRSRSSKRSGKRGRYREMFTR